MSGSVILIDIGLLIFTKPFLSVYVAKEYYTAGNISQNTRFVKVESDWFVRILLFANISYEERGIM